MCDVAAGWGSHTHWSWWSNLGLALVIKATFEDDVKFCNGHASEEEGVRLMRGQPAPENEEAMECEAVSCVEPGGGNEDNVKCH